MKRCPKCQQILPIEDFWFRPKDGCFQSYCKKCLTIASRLSRKKNKRKILSPKEKKANYILGGFKIYILNYTSLNECKFNIFSTKGKVYKTNKPSQFLDRIKEIVYEYTESIDGK